MAYTTINKGSSYFNTVTWTANGTLARAITGVGFQPDFTWIKNRSAAEEHLWYDAVRGVSKLLRSNNTAAEATTSTTVYFNSFDSDGFTIGTETAMNASGQNIVGWNWKASNATAVSNTAGTITSTVSANTTAGFSIVTYTSTTGTVGHGLGVAPKVIIMKARNLGDQWTMGHSSLPSWTYGLALNSTDGQDSNSTFWNSTAPTSTVFSQGSWDSGYTKVAYCFAEVKGYSNFSSYTGNGSADGTFVYTGFKPAFVMIKRSDTSGYGWYMFDNKRNTFNPEDKILEAQSTTAEYTGTVMDFTSNGFKLRNSGSDVNPSGGTFIYMAFAENPFVSSTQIPTTAR